MFGIDRRNDGLGRIERPGHAPRSGDGPSPGCGPRPGGHGRRNGRSRLGIVGHRTGRAFVALGLALLAVLGTGAGTGAMAQEPPRRITYDEAIRIALRQNLAVQRAENAVALRSAEVTQRKAQFLPDLRLSTQGNTSVGRTFSEQEGGIVNETTRTLNAGISSSLTLFDGGRNIANLKSAQLQEEASELELARTRQTAVMTVAQNFLSLVEGREQVRVRREALAAQEAELEQIRAMVDAGTRSIADLYQQQANVAAARAALVEAERAAELAELDLISTLRLDPAGDYEFVAPDIDRIARDTGDLDLAALIDRALERRADLDALEAREAAAEQGVKAAAASKWPTITLNAGYNTGASSRSSLGLFDQFDQRRGGSVGIGISIPLFDRLQTKTAEEQARIQAENARLDLEERRQQIALEVRSAWLGYRAAAEQLQASEARLEAAERALEATAERYRVGAATLVELTQARAAQVEAASQLVRARHALALQRTLIDYYVGDLEATASAE